MTEANDLARMADHVLAHGLAGATLRPLARAAGTSDRMLIYRFGSKEGVVTALLDYLTLRFTALLEAVDLGQPVTTADLVGALVRQMRSAEAQPYLRVWLEVTAGAARDTPAYRATAARILIHFRGWIAARLPAPGPDPQAAAAFCLAVIEGCLVLGAAGDPGAELIDQALATLGHPPA